MSRNIMSNGLDLKLQFPEDRNSPSKKSVAVWPQQTGRSKPVFAQVTFNYDQDVVHSIENAYERQEGHLRSLKPYRPCYRFANCWLRSSGANNAQAFFRYLHSTLLSRASITLILNGQLVLVVAGECLFWSIAVGCYGVEPSSRCLLRRIFLLGVHIFQCLRGGCDRAVGSIGCIFVGGRSSRRTTRNTSERVF